MMNSHSDKFAIPVAIFIFNRPQETAKVLDAVRKIKPVTLFVIADAPRQNRPEDNEKCKVTRALFDKVDWPCNVLTNYADTNLGCRRRVSSGINWVFEQTDRAIFLEDDCIPHPTFFGYSEALLERYNDDHRIMAVSGNNFQHGQRRTNYSYYFSIYPHCWGWASWRRAWQLYDDNMSHWPEVSSSTWLEHLLGNKRAASYWRQKFQATYEGKINSWAFRWTFSCWLQTGLTVLPETNLVSNIGFGEQATNTKRKRSHAACLPTKAIEYPLVHPPFVLRNWIADHYTEQNHFGNNFVRHHGRKLLQLSGAI